MGKNNVSKEKKVSTKSKIGRFFFSVFVLSGVVFVAYSYLSQGFVSRWVNQIRDISEKTPIYFAVVVPGFENYEKVSADIVRGAELCLAEQNKISENYEFRLTIIDEQSDDLMEMHGDDTNARVQEVASRIVSANYSSYYNDPAPVAVFGHWTSGRSSAASEIYNENIVALTGTALADDITAENPWYFRTVFNNATQAEFLAEFLYKSQKSQRVYVIGQEPDQYSEELTEQFETYFTALGGEIVEEIYMLDMSQESDIYQPAIEYFAKQEIEESKIPIVLLLQVNEAREFVSRLKLASRENPTLNKYTFIGSDSVSSADFANYRAAEYGTSVPDYPEGTISVSPIIYDVSSYEAQNFLRNIKEYTGNPNYVPSWRAVTFYEAACAAVQAVEDAQLTGAPSLLAEERELVKEKLTGYNSAAKSVPGIIGPVYFDKNRNITHPIMLGVYRDRNLISYSKQYFRTQSPTANEITVGNIPLHEVSISYVGIELIEVSNLELNSGTFSADFYLWFLHSRPDIDDRSVEFINSENPIELESPIEEVQINELYYRLYRVKGEFRTQFDFRLYPFDKQSIEIELRNKHKSHNDLIYVVDLIGVDAENLVQTLESSQAFSNIHGWHIEQATLYQEILSNKSALGNPTQTGQNAGKEFSVISYRIDLQRDILNFTIKNLLPVLLAVIVTYLSFFLSLEQINTTRTVVTGSLLTVALMHSSLADNLPPVDYITILDTLFYLTYFIILVEVGITVLAQRKNEAENISGATKLLKLGRVFFPLTLFVGLTLLLILR